MQDDHGRTTGAGCAGTGAVAHRRLTLDGLDIFYREAGPAGAPVLLLPHGYPCSSYQYRNLMPALADRWHVVAPDYPGFGHSATPEAAPRGCDFEGYTRFLQRFTDKLGLQRYALWLHDYGSQIGLRLAIQAPERVQALVIQNGDIYEDQLGPKYRPIQDYWEHPTKEARQKLAEAVSEEGFRAEFVGEVGPEVAARLAPDLWKLHWALMQAPARREIAVSLMEGLQDNLQWFPRYQAYLREHQPPTLILWGPQDGYMPEGAGRAYLRDLPRAQFELLPGAGHWMLETHLPQVVPLVRDFLSRAYGA